MTSKLMMARKRVVAGSKGQHVLISLVCTACILAMQPGSTSHGKQIVGIQAAGDQGMAERHVRASLLLLPLAFEKNQGQAPHGVHFLSHAPWYNVFLTRTGTVLTLQSPAMLEGPGVFAAKSNKTGEAFGAPPEIVHIKIVGASRAVESFGRNKLPGVVNYFIGSESERWRTGIPTYKAIQYRNVYPGVNLTYYGHSQQLEHDWTLAPGVDPKIIRLKIEGARKVMLDEVGAC
jgi:hypothetical protein